MDQVLPDEIRRYHPSISEQSILLPSLKRYFSYPERSPDRSRIANEVVGLLQQYSSHWNQRAVRLWFNNNRKFIYDTQVSGNSSADFSKGESQENANTDVLIACDGKKVLFPSIKKMEQTVSEDVADNLTPESVIDKNGGDPMMLQKLEDEAIWLAVNDNRLPQIIDHYDRICFNSTNQALYLPVKSSNCIDFPVSPQLHVDVISLVGLMNNKVISSSPKIWRKKEISQRRIDNLEVQSIENGYASYISGTPDGHTISYCRDPEFSNNWKSFNLEGVKNPFSMLISGKKGIIYSQCDEDLVIHNMENDIMTRHSLPDIKCSKSCMMESNNVLFMGFDKTTNPCIYHQGEIKQLSLELPSDMGINSMAYLSDGLVSALSQSTVLRMNSLDGRSIRAFIGHRGTVTSLCQLNESQFISASLDRSIRLWDVREPRPIATITSLSSNPISISGSSSYIVSGHEDSSVHVIDIRHKKFKPALGFTTKGMMPIAISINQSLDALAGFCSARHERSSVWKDSPDSKTNFFICSPLMSA